MPHFDFRGVDKVLDNMNPDIPPLKIGEKITLGATVLKFKWREHLGGEMEGKHGLVLCYLPDNENDPFVVWYFIKMYNGKLNCMHGDYVQTIDSAVRIFNKRASVGAPYKS